MQDKTREKILNILSRPYKSLPLAIDLPRLVSTIEVIRNGKTVFSSADRPVVEALMELLASLAREIQGPAEEARVRAACATHLGSLASTAGASDVLPRALERVFEDLGADEAPLVRLLKCCNQAAIGPCIVELKMALGTQFVTKDVRNSWKTEILVGVDAGPDSGGSGNSGAGLGSERQEVQIWSRKREQCIRNRFQLEWRMGVRFAQLGLVPHDLQLLVSDLLLHEAYQPGSEGADELLPLRAILARYAEPQVLERAHLQAWEFAPARPPDTASLPAAPAPTPAPAACCGSSAAAPASDTTTAAAGTDIPIGVRAGTSSKGTGAADTANPATHSPAAAATAGGTVILQVYANGDRYEGEVNEAGLRHGHGTYWTPDGDVYVGEYRNGLRHGRGVYTRRDGSRYEGEFAEGLPHGHGVYVFENGDVYTGQFVRDQFDGHGRWSSPQGDYYEGQFSGGRRHGYGVLVVRGNRYEGNWLNGQRHGYGTYTFRNGDSYTGEFRHGKFNGRGRYTFKATGQTIEAIFKDGHPLAKGTI